PGIVGKIRRPIDAKSVRAHPVPQAHADGGDLVLPLRIACGHEYTHVTGTPECRDAELGQGIDDPSLKGSDIGAHVAEPALYVKHDIADALPRAVIGVLPPASGAVDGKARFDEVGGTRAGAGGVERGMLDEPYELALTTGKDRLDAAVHHRDCGL